MSRRFRLFLAVASVVPTIAAVAAACSAPAPRSSPLNTRDDDAAGSGLPDPGIGREDAKPEQDPVYPDGGKPPGRVYAHTADTLYLFDPLARTLVRVGVLSCFQVDGGMSGDRLLDVALDRDGVMYGTSDRGFLQINPIDASCLYLRSDALVRYPNSLTFVPIGTVDQTKETLVGYQLSPPGYTELTTYVKIDTATGAVARVGELNPPNAPVRYQSSGDVVALIRDGNKAFLTVKKIGDDAAVPTDSLAEIDPATGVIKSIIGDTKARDLFGLGQWAGTGYGFSATGDIFEIDLTTAAAKRVTGLLGDAGGVPSWYGAGVTTDSPTKP